MKTFKGTKENWNLTYDEDCFIIETEKECICASIIMDDEYEKKIADAKLIAAAPDLLEALRKVLKLHRKHYKFHSLGQGFIEEADEVIEKAISKALD